ncbi:MAG: glycosyltransferase family 39 protein, partial [Spirochaetaceae bacterium]|nr:glycosyltransferase family 39 protein [Spirochaetaceae bacterium]
MSGGLLDRIRAAPYASLSAGVLAVAAYLCLVNLDYAALWHDEAPAALIGRNLLQRGDITGWDGRNLVGGTNGRTLNEDLRDVLPPLTYVFNAAGMAVFGVNETGARIVPALIGILSLGLLHLLLRQHLAGHPRLILFSLLFAAWSPQLLLYFRQSRYFAFMAFGMIAVFYLYERWWRSGRGADLAALTLVATLAFFNHYTGGAATMLALAAWHLLLRARATAPRQWLALASCGALVVAAGTAYLAWIGVIGGERSGFLAFTGVVGLEEYRGTIPPALLRLRIYTRDLFAADWISWPVLLWFAGMLSVPLIRGRRGIRPA